MRYRPVERAVVWFTFALFLAYFGLYCFRAPWAGDFQRHCASVASLYLNFLHPSHEAVAAPGAQSEVHTPYIVAIAGIGRLLRVTPYRALQLAALFNLGFYIFAIVFFFRIFSLAPRSWLPPFFFLLVSLCMRNRVYWWASETSFQTIRAILSYPSMFAWGAALTVFALAGRFCRRPGRAVLTIAVLVWALVLSHSITASWVIGVIGVLGLVELVRRRGERAAWRRVLILYAATAAGVGLTYFWPYFDITKSAALVQFSEGSTFADHPFRDMSSLYLLAAVAGGWFLWTRRHGFLLAGFAATWGALELFRALHYSYGNRYAFFQAFFAQAAVAEAAALGVLVLFGQRNEVADGWPTWVRRLAPIFAAAAIVLSLAAPSVHFRIPGFATIYAMPSSEEAYYRRLGRLPSRIGPGDVVLMPYSYAIWDVASITGARAVVAPFAYRLPDFQKRLDDVARFFTAGQDPRVRADIIRRYGVDKVLLTTGYLDLAREFGPHETIVTSSGPWLLIDVRPHPAAAGSAR